MKSVVDTFEGRIYAPSDVIDVTKAIEEANQVASYGYEYRTCWGKQVCHTNLYISIWNQHAQITDYPKNLSCYD
jgi:hypothetical protein